jgi:hydroxymethylpyrimidine/phosphomethylpyrimidine kinase
MKTVMTIAGSDPSGGAGIQADLKVFAALGCYGVSAISAETIQNSRGVKAVFPIPGEILSQEIEALIEDFQVSAVKIGMLATKVNVEKVALSLRHLPTKEIVLDPVLLSTNGVPLLDDDALPFLLKALLPQIKVVTPNLYEAGVLAGEVVKDKSGMERSAKTIHSFGVENVLVKGGHLQGEATDIFFDGTTYKHFKGEKIQGKEIHGTGCVLSAAITVGLAEGLSVWNAIERAKVFLGQKIKDAQKIGEGALLLT